MKAETELPRRARLVATIAAVVLGAGSALLQFRWDRSATSIQSIQSRIETLNRIRSSLKDLEQFTTDQERNLQDLGQRLDKLSHEKAEAEALLNLTRPQVEALTSAIRRRSWSERITDGIIGFATGILTSVLGSYLYEKYKRFKDVG